MSDGIAGAAGSLVVLFGALAGIGVFAFVLGFIKKPPKDETQTRLRKFRYKRQRADMTQALAENAFQVGTTVVGAVLVFYTTGWPASLVLGGLTGWFGPLMARAPAKRRKVTDEIEAYSQWTEQIRDLVGASGSLFEAVTLSADNAPRALRTPVKRMSTMARTVGLPPALDWFAAEMRSPYADRLVLGMKIAWDSGARVTEAFESTARGMRTEVDMRRRNEVANSRAWTQVVSILAVTFVCVAFMFLFNSAYFDPFGSVLGQGIMLVVCVLIFGNVFWVLKLSETGTPIRLLADSELDPRVSMLLQADEQ